MIGPLGLGESVLSGILDWIDSPTSGIIFIPDEDISKKQSTVSEREYLFNINVNDIEREYSHE